jgi:hypothetical protein
MADFIPSSPDGHLSGPATMDDVLVQELGKAHELFAWLAQHPVVAILWGWISLSLILHLWLARRQRQTGWIKKVIWSCVLLIPVLGWLFYGGFFNMPDDKGHTRAGAGIDTGNVTGGSSEGHHGGDGHF